MRFLFRDIRRLLTLAILVGLLAPLGGVAFAGGQAGHAGNHGFHHHADGGSVAAMDEHDRIGCSIVVPCDHGFCASMVLPEPVFASLRGELPEASAVAASIDGLPYRPLPPPPRHFS